MRSRAPYFLLYDGDCRVCSAFARAAHILDHRGMLHVRPIQDSGELLSAIPPAERLAGAHAVSPGGRVTSGGDALPAILAALVAGPRFEGRIRSSRASMAALARVYAVMSDVRGRLSCADGGPASAGRSPR